MSLQRILSISASSSTLLMVLISLAFSSHYDWLHYKNMRKHPARSTWNLIIEWGITCVSAIALGISLVICSLFGSEKAVVTVIIIFERFLFVKQVISLWKVLSKSEPIVSWLPPRIIRWVVLGVSVCLGSTIVIIQGLFSKQNLELVLRVSLVLFTSEFLEISCIYAYLGWDASRGKNAYNRFQLTLTFLVNFIGAVVGVAVFFLKQGNQISWMGALWLHFGTAQLWLVRSLVLGLYNCGLGGKGTQVISAVEVPC